MTKWDDPVDTPGEWQREHLRRYVETDGAEGHMWNLPWAELRSSPDAPTLLLTTRGRRSGKLRRTPLIYGQDGDRYLVVASAGGAPQHPAWYLNLAADPRVQVQVRGERFEAEARTATEEEKPRLWQEMARIWPAYDEYQTKTDRQLPVVILQPVAA
jgi:deazaflavin-dependent oxidoreductase (nitroreductase family)